MLDLFFVTSQAAQKLNEMEFRSCTICCSFQLNCCKDISEKQLFHQGDIPFYHGFHSWLLASNIVLWGFYFLLSHDKLTLMLLVSELLRSFNQLLPVLII